MGNLSFVGSVSPNVLQTRCLYLLHKRDDGLTGLVLKTFITTRCLRIILKQSGILVRENDLIMPHHATAESRGKSPVVVVLSSCPIGRAHPLTTPASRRLLMLMLPRLRRHGSPIRSFSDSARWRCEPVSPADVRLKMARRPCSDDERVGATASLVAFIGH